MRARVVLLGLLALVLLPLPASGWMTCLLGTPSFEATLTLPAGTSAAAVRTIVAERPVGLEGLLTTWEADDRAASMAGCLPGPKRRVLERLLVPGALEFAEVLDASAAEILQPVIALAGPIASEIEANVHRHGDHVQASLRCRERSACERFVATRTPPGGRWISHRIERYDRLGRSREAWEALLVGRSALDGRLVEEARLSDSAARAGTALSATLSAQAGRRFGQLTARLEGRRLAVLVDGRLLSAPVVRARIDGGHVFFPTDLEPDAARALAAALSTRALPEGIRLASFEAK